ncbi:MAG: nucleotidyl transferase AbiEii/AbiGii toxin family protein [Oligoflexia bacterium]|nr:nucleotidyl transferase AbiEii/AbiGii toxin family protein [Oligoflexia bacterium]
MINLRKTLTISSACLQAQGIEHALIGGFALAAHGINRATADIDFLADGKKKNIIIESLTKSGFKLVHQTDDVLQFQGVGNLDIILANRPLSQKMLSLAQDSEKLSTRVVMPEDIIGLKIQAYKNEPTRELQDKADIQALILAHNSSMDWKRIKEYADLFNEWEVIKKLGGNSDIR